MRMDTAFLLVSATLLTAIVGDAKAQPARRSRTVDTVHVLLIGNSYLYFHNTPKLLEKIATSRDGPIVLTRLVAHGGWSLADHWGDSATRSALRERSWDWVVLNEQSTFGETYLVDGKNRVHTWSAFAAAAARFSSEAKQTGARLAIVSHWSKEKAPTRDDEALRFAFDSVARSLRAVLIPAGAAWHSPEVANRRISLYAADGSHPSAAGSFLLASLLYAFLTSKNPTGAPGAIKGPFVEEDDGIVHPDSIVTLVNLPTGDTETLQQVAWDVYRRATSAGGYLLVWRPEPISLPSLSTRGEPITRSALIGTWRGTTTIYPVSPAAVLELQIESAGDSLHGTLRRALRPTPEATEVVPVSVSLAGDVVTITDPMGPNHGSVRYQGTLRDGTLTGIVEFLIPAPMLNGIGTWRLTRAR